MRQLMCQVSACATWEVMQGGSHAVEKGCNLIGQEGVLRCWCTMARVKRPAAHGTHFAAAVTQGKLTVAHGTHYAERLPGGDVDHQPRAAPPRH